MKSPPPRLLLSRLLSLEFWIWTFSAAALTGILLIVAGEIERKALWMRIGFWLEMPLLILGALLVTVAVPILLFLNRKHRRAKRQKL